MRATRRTLPASPRRETSPAAVLPREGRRPVRATAAPAAWRTDAERALALVEMRASVASAANLGETPEGVLRLALAELCAALRWPVARAALLDVTGNPEGEPIWHTASPSRFTAFRVARDATANTDPRSAAGRALAAAEPVWATSTDMDAPRAGLEGAIAFPVAAGPIPVAMVELWSTDAEHPGRDVLDACAWAARQLGAAVEHLRERASLRAQAQALRALVAAAPAGAVALDADSEPRLWSSTAEELLGGAPRDASTAWPVVRSTAARVARTGRRATRTVEAPDATGLPRTLRVRVAPISTPDGGVDAAAWIYPARPAPTPAARPAESHAPRWRDQAVAAVSHDLRNPLNSISLAAELLQRNWPADPALMHERTLLDSIYTSAEQMRTLVMDLLDQSRLDADGIPVSPEPVSVASLLAGAEASHRLLAAERGITLEVETVHDCDVLADEGRMAQVLSNLIGNALGHTPAGGRVTVRAERTSDVVRVSVSDTGRGIPSENLDRIFDRFWRGDTGRPGAGLGLSIARSIVEAHGGRIRAESAPGHGATLVFTLPVA
jgi:signal transduction histidine kinase